MATNRAHKWAYFLKRLGFPNSNESIMTYVDSVSDDEVWERFISSNPCALEACKKSKIFKVEDTYWLFDEISYATMRSSFPANSHGMRPIGPKIIPMENDANAQGHVKTMSLDKQRKEVQNVYPPLSDDFIGRQVVHTVFGEGVLVRIQERNLIVIKFNSCGEKLLSYNFCIEKGYLEFI